MHDVKQNVAGGGVEDSRGEHPPANTTQHPPANNTQHQLANNTQHQPANNTQHPPAINTQHPTAQYNNGNQWVYIQELKEVAIQRTIPDMISMSGGLLTFGFGLRWSYSLFV